jgi:ABC-type sugar transport system permease subunit
MKNKENITPNTTEEVKTTTEVVAATEEAKASEGVTTTEEVEVVDDTAKAAEQSAAEAGDKSAKDKKKKKKKVYSIDEILAEGGRNADEYDENGKKRKIKVKTKSKLKAKEARMGYLFTFPWLVGTCLLLIYPLFLSAQYSVCTVKSSALGIRVLGFVGLENYTTIISLYQTFLTDLGSLVIRMILSVPVIVVFALLMAMLLNLNLKGRGIFRTIYFLPVIVVSGPVMEQLSSDGSSISAVDTSAINQALSSVLPSMLASSIGSVFASILTILWYGGVQILIFLAALQKIDSSLYEAAKMDGGSGWECFWKITLPTIKPMILLNAIYTVIFLSQDTNSNTIINQIEFYRFDTRGGYDRASALGWMYSIVILLLIAVTYLLLKPKKDAYIKQVKKQRRFEKKTRKALAKSHKAMIKNAAKFEKHVAKQEAQRAAGKKVKGGERIDD